jgi:UDP-GlcNAc:undecaprenyl-phosphate GlcNAc-1-phosphate transferase
LYYYLASLFVLLFFAEIFYFKIADRYNIIDKPNERSSHTRITIRGGGIVFLIAGLAFAIYSGFKLPFFWTGFLLISLVSFIDDVKTLSSRLRLPLHFIAVMLMLYQGLQMDSPLWIWLVGLILATGIINAYNFMDGINGITAGYSLVVLLSLLAINQSVCFTNNEFIVVFIIADIVFGFFNFRRKARCFAGDVGSVSIAFVIVFLLLQLILTTQNLFFILLLSVYGVDSVLTIVYRIRNRENIFEAHRSHLYQWLVKPGPFTHLQMSGIYMFLQALISIGVVFLIDSPGETQIIYASIILIALGITYLVIKNRYIRVHELV